MIQSRDPLSQVPSPEERNWPDLPHDDEQFSPSELFDPNEWQELDDGFGESGLDEDLDEWDEPETSAEYDAKLRQPLYVIQGDDPNLIWTLQLDEWVSGLPGATNSEKIQVADLLRSLGRNRWRRWLPWLNEQMWNGDTLLRFLRFRFHWESNPHWWEYCFWDWRTGSWYPTRNRDTLRRSDAYELIQLRTEYRPWAVIDPAWLVDWLEWALWKHGFRSFASFALFRARSTLEGDWVQELDWRDEDEPSQFGKYDPNQYDATIEKYPVRRQFHRRGPLIWFCGQDWYDAREWHDNLGW